ncbi:hypothetical protein GH721_15275 [Kriegella sp. EG-1]|nr:hypothetical protein [Flavobacteriaceae bacterium EG-1]
MKRIIGLVIMVLALSCDSDRTIRNPYIQEIGFRIDLNLSLPLYSPLTNPNRPIYVGTDGVGNRGIFVINAGFDQFRAFEATCPNHPPNSCSTMKIDGINAICECEDYEYSLYTGQQLNMPDDDKQYYNLLEYRAVQSGNSVIISN